MMDEHELQQRNAEFFASKLDPNQPLTAQHIQSIVTQLQAIQVDGKAVFERVYVDRPGYGRVNVCAETFASTAKMLFYISEEEIEQLELGY